MIERLAGGDQVPGESYWRKLHEEVYQETKAALPLAITQRPDGKLLEDQSPLTLDAIITSRTGAAYSWAEAYRNAGAWITMPGGRTGTANAYHYNLSSLVPNGAVVELTYTTAGDWRFERICAPCGSPSQYCVKVTYCRNLYNSSPLEDFNVPDATVDVTGPGAYSATGTTDSMGVVCFTLPVGGIYTFTITPPVIATPPGSLWAIQTITRNITYLNGSLFVSLEPIAGYHCGCCATIPAPDTLYLTDKYGTHALTWSGVNWSASISVYETEAGSDFLTCGGGVNPCTFGIGSHTPGSIDIIYTLYCFTNPDRVTTWRLTKAVYAATYIYEGCCDSYGNCPPYLLVGRMYPASQACAAGLGRDTTVVSGCSPVSVSIVIPGRTINRGRAETPILGYSDTVTISE